MAEKISSGAEDAKKLADGLKQIERINEQIRIQNEKMATARLKEQRSLQERIKSNEKILEQLQEEVNKLQKKKDLAEKEKDLNKFKKDTLSYFGKMDKDAVKLITDKVTKTNVLASISQRIIDYADASFKAEKANNIKSQEANQVKLNFFKEQADKIKEQAEDIVRINKGEVTSQQTEAEILKFKKEIQKWNKDEIDDAIKLLQLNQKLAKESERVEHINEGLAKVNEALPVETQEIVNKTKEWGAALKSLSPYLLAFGVLALGVESFVELDEAAEQFRKDTGYTRGQMDKVDEAVHDINMEYKKFGVQAKDVYDITNELKNEFSDITQFSKETTAALSVMKNNLGISASDSAKFQAVFEEVGGLSQKTAANVGMQVARMSRLAGVSPKEVLEDIAHSSEVTSKFFKGDVDLLKQQAIQAHQLGTNLESVAAISEKLLDFEGGIEDELKAATFVGGQFNLSRARGLAMEGKIVEAQQETLDQIQRSGDFRKQDYFTQQQLAKAANMTIPEINKQLKIREKLSKLSGDDLVNATEAINKGLDLSDVSEDQLKSKVDEFAVNNRINGQMADLGNAFKSIGENIGGTLMPLFKGIADVLLFITDHASLLGTLMGAAVAYGVLMYVNNQKAAAAKAEEAALQLEVLQLQRQQLVASGAQLVESEAQLGVSEAKTVSETIGSFVSSMGPVGLLLGLAAIGGIIGAISSAKNAGDINSPAGGGTMVSTKEGGLFNLSPNDDLVAAPGASKALAGGGGGGNLAILSAPLNAMITELKALRTDLSSGKIAVYMDSQKVTNNIGKTADKTTRNNYSLI